MLGAANTSHLGMGVRTDTRFKEIDGLRGIAATLVMIAHWGEVSVRHQVPAPLQHAAHATLVEYFSPGRMAVVAFFCISGFVIPFSFRGRYPLLSFPISRVFRLYPAFWLAVLAGAAVGYITGDDIVSPARLLVNLTMLHLLVGVGSIIGVDWTLLIEWVFYGVCYLMFAAAILGRPRYQFAAMLTFLGIALAAGAWRWVHPSSGLPLGIPTYLAAMHFGTLARMHLLDRTVVSRNQYLAAIGCLVGGVLLAYFLAYWKAENEQLGYWASNTGYFAGIAIFLLCIHLQLFTGRVTVFLGRISYSVYLLHPVAVVLLMSTWDWFSGWEAAYAVLTPLYFLGVLGAATLMFELVERPMVRLGRKLDDTVTTAVAARRPAAGV